MTLASMTGFARAAGSAGPWSLAWELKSVNAKGLDARLRLPLPFEAIEPDARARLSRRSVIVIMCGAICDWYAVEVSLWPDFGRQSTPKRSARV